MRALELRQRAKAHQYIRESLEQIEVEMKDQQKFVWAQVDKMAEREKLMEKLYFRYKDDLAKMKYANTELVAYSRWE